MTMNKFETSMDRIVKSVEGDSPTTNIYADPIERIADALENGSGGGGSGSGGDVVYIDTVLADGELVGIAESYNSLKALYDAHKTVRFNYLLTESGDGFTHYMNFCPILVTLEQGEVYSAVFVSAEYNGGANTLIFKADTAEVNMLIED